MPSAFLGGVCVLGSNGRAPAGTPCGARDDRSAFRLRACRHQGMSATAKCEAWNHRPRQFVTQSTEGPGGAYDISTVDRRASRRRNRALVPQVVRAEDAKLVERRLPAASDLSRVLAPRLRRAPAACRSDRASSRARIAAGATSRARSSARRRASACPVPPDPSRRFGCHLR